MPSLESASIWIPFQGKRDYKLHSGSERSVLTFIALPKWSTFANRPRSISAKYRLLRQKKSIDQESNYADSPITNTNETASFVTVTLLLDSVSINLLHWMPENCVPFLVFSVAKLFRCNGNLASLSDLKMFPFTTVVGVCARAIYR